ncbi:hypothetical protein MRX96_055707 [Rhipicephalus microplus]
MRATNSSCRRVRRLADQLRSRARPRLPRRSRADVHRADSRVDAVYGRSATSTVFYEVCCLGSETFPSSYDFDLTAIVRETSCQGFVSDVVLANDSSNAIRAGRKKIGRSRRRALDQSQLRRSCLRIVIASGRSHRTTTDLRMCDA